jgi:hypothetical protein
MNMKTFFTGKKERLLVFSLIFLAQPVAAQYRGQYCDRALWERAVYICEVKHCEGGAYAVAGAYGRMHMARYHTSIMQATHSAQACMYRKN